MLVKGKVFCSGTSDQKLEVGTSSWMPYFYLPNYDFCRMNKSLYFTVMVVVVVLFCPPKIMFCSDCYMTRNVSIELEIL